jgi:spore coat polysaccharide biosynthesis protein SpsF
LAGAPLLARQIERVSRSRRLDSLVVAVSDHHDDEQAARVAAREGVAVMRHPPGPSDAVLRRALAQNPADHVVRMTANAPFMDAAIIDATSPCT